MTLKRALKYLWFLLVLIESAGFADAVDLHAHLFFHEGVGLAWFGSFAGPIRATSWKDRIRSKVNEEDLINSGEKIVAVALYAHPLFLGSQRNSIRRQIFEARKFVSDHRDEWAIAKSPLDASRALASGKRVLILTLEGASGVLETDEDLDEFIVEQGIRIVTPIHFLDDEFGGAALMPGIRGLLSPLGWLESFFHPRSVDGTLLNPNGLGPRGAWLVRQLLKRGVWIDLSHASDRWQDQVTPILAQAKQPLLYTHTMLRRYYQAERGVSKAQLQAVKASGGIVGIIPSEDMVGMTPHAGACPGGIDALAEQYAEIAAVVGADSVSLGTDINAPLNFLPSPCGDPTGSEQGFFHYAELQDVWHALLPRVQKQLQKPSPARKSDDWSLTTNHFLQVWARVRPYP